MFKQGGGIIVPRGDGGGAFTYVRGVHYAHAQRLNTALLAFGAHLLHAQGTAVSWFNATGGPYDATRLYGNDGGGGTSNGTAVASLRSTGWPTDQAAWLVGEFALPGNRTAVLLTNQDDAHNQLTTVVLAGEGTVVEVDPGGRGEALVRDDAP